jgi:hypothetical protein
LPVWHVARAPEGAIFIGRPSRWGNPFPITRAQPREVVVERYRRDLWRRVQAGDVTLEELAGLHGKHLACFCKPYACHGDVLERAAAWAAAVPVGDK